MSRAALALVVGVAVLAALVAGCGGSDAGRGEASERATTAPSRAGTDTTAQAPADRPVTAADVSEHLEALQRIADRHGGNRAAGSGGDRETADYIAGRLREAGWTVRLQTVRFPYFEEVARPVLDGLQRSRDFRVLEYSPGADVRARVRPLDTQGCEQAALAPIDEGDIAMVARGTCTFRRKAQNAQREGAAALLVVDRRADEPAAATLGRPNGVDIPVIAVTGRAAARLARSTTAVTLRVRTKSEERETRNVIAETRRAARVAMAGAHHDSVEEGPGINDNGSGVAALLEAAERLRDRPGLRLGFWAAEELGLYGSRRYVDDLDRAERRAIRAYVNFDMVGSPNPRPQVYDGDDTIERTLRRALPGDEGETGLGAASDHASFAGAEIPVGGLFTGDSQRADPCYHRRCDTIRNADAAMTARMSQALVTALPRLTR